MWATRVAGATVNNYALVIEIDSMIEKWDESVYVEGVYAPPGYRSALDAILRVREQHEACTSDGMWIMAGDMYAHIDRGAVRIDTKEAHVGTQRRKESRVRAKGENPNRRAEAAPHASDERTRARDESGHAQDGGRKK